jgi:hypothetical protein
MDPEAAIWATVYREKRQGRFPPNPAFPGEKKKQSAVGQSRRYLQGECPQCLMTGPLLAYVFGRRGTAEPLFINAPGASLSSPCELT